jgi:hypothetical protein
METDRVSELESFDNEDVASFEDGEEVTNSDSEREGVPEKKGELD